MKPDFNKLDERAYEVCAQGAYYILIEKKEKGWGAKIYFNGGVDVSVGPQYTTHEGAYYALKDKVAEALSQAFAAEL